MILERKHIMLEHGSNCYSKHNQHAVTEKEKNNNYMTAQGQSTITCKIVSVQVSTLLLDCCIMSWISIVILR